MSQLQGVLGLIVILAVAFGVSRDRRAINPRTIVVGLILQVAFAFLVLKWSVGRDVLDFAAKQVATLVGYTEEGSKFLFGRLLEGEGTVFALQVLPVIVFLGALTASCTTCGSSSGSCRSSAAGSRDCSRRARSSRSGRPPSSSSARPRRRCSSRPTSTA